MKFSEIANRLTGISTPLGGVSWQSSDLEVSAARRVIAFLEDRRVLYAPEEEDGSFRVYVRLTWDAPPEKPLICRVAAVVVQEDGHFVLDDVIFLKDQNREAEARLSQYLSAGCDGTHWVGYGNKNATP